MKKFFQNWLGSILVVVTIAFFTFYGGRASQVDLKEIKNDLKVTQKLVQKNAETISGILGYIDAQKEQK